MNRIKKYKPNQEILPFKQKPILSDSEKNVKEFEAKGISD
jgi:hypothetical protein